MLITKLQFQGYQIKHEITKKIENHEESRFFYKFFCNALKNFPTNIDEEAFLEILETTNDLIDQACLYILVSKLGNTVLEKDPCYISELCTSMTMKEVSPQFFDSIALYFLSEPIYSLIQQINRTSYLYGYITLFDIIIDNFDLFNLDEWEKNKIIKTLNALLNQDYHILFPTIDTLNDIFLIMYQKMLEINRQTITYTAIDFKKVILLKTYSESSDIQLKAELTQDLINCEHESFDAKTIIDKCLKTIEEYRYRFAHITLSRRTHHEKK